MTDLPMDIEGIRRLLPHRYPFLLIDRVTELSLNGDKTVTAIKNVTANELFFQGHFPGHPVMPGVLIIEAMAQAAGVLGQTEARRENPDKEKLYYLVKVDNARFTRRVVPGDQLTLKVRQKRVTRGMAQYECECWVGDEKAASAELLCAERRDG